jgi:hypothetical protein
MTMAGPHWPRVSILRRSRTLSIHLHAGFAAASILQHPTSSLLQECGRRDPWTVGSGQTVNGVRTLGLDRISNLVVEDRSKGSWWRNLIGDRSNVDDWRPSPGTPKDGRKPALGTTRLWGQNRCLIMPPHPGGRLEYLTCPQSLEVWKRGGASNILRTAVSPGWDPQYLTPHWPSTASISDPSPFLTEKPRETLEVCFELFQLLKR